MEPRSIERGEPLNIRLACRSRRIPLQWSHVQSNVESQARGRTDRDHRDASMEPRSIERGEVLSDMGWHKLAEASMEPRSIERGEQNLSIAT